MLPSLAWTLPPPSPALSSIRSVHIWRASLNDPRIAALLPTHLAPAEHKSINRPNSRLSRVVLRNVLSRYCHLPPSSLLISRHVNGKPFLSGGPYFNIAHTDHVVLLAVSSQPVGIDIEHVNRRLSNLPRLLRRFSPTEAAAVVKAADQHAAFLRLWTRKEAFLKCTGDGIRRGLSTFSIPLRDGEWTVDNRDDHRAAQTFHGVDVPLDDHFASLVCLHESPVLSRFEWHTKS